MNRSASIIVCFGKYILLGKKSSSKKWDSFGGGVDAGETFRQAAKREFFEETQVDLQGVITPATKRIEEDKIHCTYFYKSPEMFDVHLSEEHSNFKWCHINKLPKNTSQKFLKDLKASLKLIF